ncbi:MAG: tetratricopeptide repeat protein [Desulfomonile tiedjei]|nr:tetratricopeptide repeat protein [Desulfomonile tiedjei]
MELLSKRLLATGAFLLLLSMLAFPDPARSLTMTPPTESPSVAFQGTFLEKIMGGGSALRLNVETPGRPEIWPRKPAEQVQAPEAPEPPAESPRETSQPAAPVPDATTGGAALEGEQQPEVKNTDAAEKLRPVPEPKDAKKAEPASAVLKKAAEFLKQKDYEAALAQYQLVLKKGSSPEDQKLMAAALSGAASASHHLNRDKEALNYVNRAIILNQSLKNAKERSLNYLLSGRILMAQSNYSLALKSYEESLKILPTSESSEMPRLLEEMATCLMRLDKYSDALSTLNRLLSAFAKEKNDAETARISLMVGEIQVSRSDFRSARSNFQKAEKIYREMNRGQEAGETLFRMAYIDQILGDLKSAQQAVEEGQALLKENGDVSVNGLPLMVKGMAAYSEGKIIPAVKSLTAALNQYEKAGDRMMAARVRLTLANLEMDRSNLKSALEMGGRSLEEFRSLSAAGSESAALNLIAEVYFRQGFVQKSLEYAQESLAVAKKVADRNQMAHSRVLLADIHSSLGDVEFASKLLKEAVEEAKAGVNRRIKAQVLLAVARFRLAREAWDKALQDAAQARADFQEINDRRGMADADHLMGLAYELRGERDKSFSLLQAALNEHRALWDRFGEGRDLTALGVHFKNLGDHDKALEHFSNALNLRNGIGDRRGYAANLANIGNLKRHQHHSAEALKSLEDALAVYRELSDKKGEADILTNLGNVDAARGMQSAALEKFTMALKLHREIRDTRGASTDLASLGRLYLAKGDLQNAASNLEEAQKLNKRIYNPRGDVAILSELAMVHRAKKNSQAALSTLKAALELAGQINDSRAVASINLKLATVLEDSGEHNKALALLGETLATMRQQEDRIGELWALGSIGVIQAKLEDYESALASLQQAAKLQQELDLSASQSRDLDFHLGEIYEGFRDYERALEHYHKALAVSQNPGNDSGLGKIYDRIGNIYYQIEEYAKARDFLEDALRIHSETRNVAMQKTELIRLGDVLSKLGDSEAALRYQLKALTLARETGDERTDALILTRIGTLYQILGRQRTALEHYREAYEKRTKVGDRRGVNENLLQIALVTSILGDFEEAVADLKRAFEIAQCSEDRSMLWKAYFIMGRTLEGKKSPGEALESYRKAITILEAMEADIIGESDEDDFIFGGKKALFETTLRVLMNLAKKDPDGAYDQLALRIVEKLKAAAFENALSRINVDGFSDLPQELLLKEKSLRLSLRRLNSHLAEELSKINPDQAAIKKLLDERRAKEQTFMALKDRLVKEYPSYADLRYPRPVSVHQLQQSIVDQDEAILEFMVTRSRTYLFAIDKHRFYTHSVDYATKDLERDIDALTRPLYRADTQASWDPSVAYRLYSKLIKPVEYFLAGKKTVMIIPHGPLSSLPFELLVDSQAHSTKRFWSASERPSYLLEKYAFCYAPSAASLSHIRTRKRDKKPGWNLVAFGDAVYSDPEKKKEFNPGADKLMAMFTGGPRGARGNELKPLPGARKEISEIVKIVTGPTQTYLGPQATETLFKKADLSRYNYVHLATHGVLLSGAGKFQNQPAILFSLYGDQENDGFLQAGEVFGLKLNSDLVVISSCLSSEKTQPGEGGAMLGLARAFLFAGTDSVILSMWQVNDESTAKLFIEMYRNLKEGSKSDALRQAKLTLLNSPGTSHPYYWAPFVLMGNWKVSFRPSSNAEDPKNMRFKGVSTWRKLLSM